VNCPHCNAYNRSDASYCANCSHATTTVNDRAHGRVEENPSTDPYDQRYTLSNATSQRTTIPVRDLRGLLSATFAIYQENLGVLFRIALVAQIPFFVAALIPSDIMASAISMAGVLTGLLANAAVTYLVAQRYLGRITTAANSYAAALSYGTSLLINLGAYLAVMIALGILIIGLPLLVVIGLPLLVFAVVAWFLYVQAVMVEGKGPGTALTRSWKLVQGTWWRVCGIVIVFGILPSLVIFAINWIAGDLIAVVGGVLVTPIAYIGTVLLYLDLRARKEGYTLEQLASDMSASPDTNASQ
jgi:hypothetical protein